MRSLLTILSQVLSFKFYRKILILQNDAGSVILTDLQEQRQLIKPPFHVPFNLTLNLFSCLCTFSSSEKHFTGSYMVAMQVLLVIFNLRLQVAEEPNLESRASFLK